MKFSEKDLAVMAANKDLPPSKRTMVPSMDSLATTLSLIASGPFARENCMPVRDTRTGKIISTINAAEYLARYIQPTSASIETPKNPEVA